MTSRLTARSNAFRGLVGLSVGCLLAQCVLVASAQADDVFLKNGSSFDDVMTEARASSLLIKLPYGVLEIGWDRVARVDSGETPMEGYRARRKALESKGAAASEWLELAIWARDHDLSYRCEEALVIAAHLAPELDGLAPHLLPLGYTFDLQRGRWMTKAEQMRLRGFVQDQGDWITPAELQARREARLQRERRRLFEEQERRLDRIVELLALSRLDEARQRESAPETARDASPQPHPGLYAPVAYSSPTVIFGSGFSSSGGNAAVLNDLLHRVPGSILPLGFGRP